MKSFFYFLSIKSFDSLFGKAALFSDTYSLMGWDLNASFSPAGDSVLLRFEPLGLWAKVIYKVSYRGLGDPTSTNLAVSGVE